MRNYTAFFGQFHDDLALRRQRDQHLRRRFFTAYRYLFWLVLLIVTLIYLWSAWPNIITGTDDHAPGLLIFDWIALIYTTPIGSGPLILTLFRISEPAIAGPTFSAIRGVIVARDVSVAPAAETTNAAPIAGDTADNNPQGIETIAPLAHPLGWFGAPNFLYPLGVLAGCAFLGLAAYFTTHGEFQTGPYWESLIFHVTAPMAFGSIGLVIVIGIGSAWLWRRRGRRSFAVQVDTAGITIQLSGRGSAQSRFEWADIHGFALTRFQDDISRTHTTFTVFASDRDFLWDMPPVNRYDKPAVIARQQTQHDAALRLAQIVEQQTGLHALDISDIMRVVQMSTYRGSAEIRKSIFEVALAIVRASGDKEAAKAIWEGTHPGAGEAPADEVSPITGGGLYMSLTPKQRDEIVRYARALLPYYPRPEQESVPPPDLRGSGRRTLRATWKSRLLFAFGLCYVAVLGFNTVARFWNAPDGYALGWYPPAMLRTLPAQTAEQTPIYNAPFSGLQAGWPTRVASAADTRSARFTPNGYELSATDPNQVYGVWTPLKTPGDSAVEMTIRLTSSQSNAGDAGGGMLLNVSPNGSRALAFIINQYGGVTLDTCHNLNSPQGACDHLLFDSFSQSPYPDDGAANTLLAIHRGQMYFFYLNNAPVFVYRDTIGEAGASGYVGAYLDQGGGNATITYVAIYPTPATLPFWAR